MGETDDPSSCPDEPEPRSATALVDLIDPGCLVEPRVQQWLADRARTLLTHLRLAGELRIELVDDATMSAAHARWKNDPTTTDVLTFDLRSSQTEPLDTDLMVCVDEARRQAAARGLPTEHELLLYIVHGLLHCTGHDDQDHDSAQAMHKREDELLAVLGLGPVYAHTQNGAES